GPIRGLNSGRVADTARCRLRHQAASSSISGSADDVSVTDELPVSGSKLVLAISHVSTDSGSVWVALSATPTVSPGSKCAVLRVDTSRSRRWRKALMRSLRAVRAAAVEL